MLSLIALALINCAAAEECCCGDWQFTAGANYVIPFTYHTVGNLANDSFEGSSFLVGHKNLKYTNTLGINLGVATWVTSWCSLGLNYEYWGDTISTCKSIEGDGDLANQFCAYSGDLTANTLLVKSRFYFPMTWALCGSCTQFYAGAGIGASNLYLSRQEIAENLLFILDSPAPQSSGQNIANHNRWNFAYSFELGASTQSNPWWQFNYGVRYTNYGRFSSGTTPVGSVLNAGNFQAPVSAHLEAVSVFLEISAYF